MKINSSGHINYTSWFSWNLMKYLIRNKRTIQFDTIVLQLISTLSDKYLLPDRDTELNSYYVCSITREIVRFETKLRCCCYLW